MGMDLGNTGHAIRVMRKAQRLSLASLAAKAKINTSYLSQIERGEREPSDRVLAAIHEALSQHLRGVA